MINNYSFSYVCGYTITLIPIRGVTGIGSPYLGAREPLRDNNDNNNMNKQACTRSPYAVHGPKASNNPFLPSLSPVASLKG